VQTFYQPLFSNSPLAISLQQFFFLWEFFSLPKASHIQKAFPIRKPKAKASKQRGKSLASSFSESLIPSGKQGGAAVLGERRDIVKGETCIPASLNVNNLEAAVLHFPLSWPGLCLSWCTDKHLRKSS
jgi:hypothetical protein